MTKRGLGAVIVTLFACASVAAQAERAIDDRVRDVASQLMCPVCEGRTVAESNSQLAGQMRDLIRQRLLAGDPPNAIVHYFVERYGEGALAAPPARGLGVLVWAVPALCVLLGIVVVVSRVRRRAAPELEDVGTDAPLTPAEADRLAQGLGELKP
jgi:cytochrome c-type biogenesis protein CcmH